MTKSNLVEKSLFQLTIIGSHSITEGSWGRDLRLELKQKPWWDTTYWLVPHGLFSLTSYTTQDLGQAYVCHHSSELGPPISIINPENALQTCL